MTTRRSPYTRAPESFRLLPDHPDQTLGVLLHWDIDQTWPASRLKQPPGPSGRRDITELSLGLLNEIKARGSGQV
ncbi:MAG: hypothetical protein OXG64_01530 [Chloroflexi bacterium]|nr:hypothetical protein [Chloroflexota bacterium]MCY3956733.1 hypothetical protein [Chloroflexota bacterium]